MGGQDVKKGGVYKKDSVFREKGRQTQVSKKEKETRRILREEREKCNFLYNIALLGQACVETFAHLFYNISPFFLILILGQSPLLLFVSFSYKVYWFGQRLNSTTHLLKWLGPPTYLVLTTAIVWVFGYFSNVNLCFFFFEKQS